MAKGSAGDIAFEWEGLPRRFVLLTQGSIRVRFRTRDRRVPWAECRAFGGQDCMPVSASILARSEIAVRAVCLQPSRWLALPPDRFRCLVNENTAFRRALFEQHAARLPAFFARTSAPSGLSTVQRLAEWLLGNADEDRIDVTHQQIASELVTVREVVSRNLKRFVESGWIEQGRGWIRVVHPEALSRKASISPRSAGYENGASHSPEIGELAP
ncbi:MAG: Crp/Fnr family transcriptional regulator [Paracoccaceae bacterium]